MALVEKDARLTSQLQRKLTLLSAELFAEFKNKNNKFNQNYYHNYDNDDNDAKFPIYKPNHRECRFRDFSNNLNDNRRKLH